MNAPEIGPRLTEDRYFGGRLTLRQPARGLRAGDDALILAAAVPAAAGDRLIEAGVGTGAAALALLARVAGTQVLGIEVDAGHAALARDNAALNGFGDRLEVVGADIADATAARLREAGIAIPFAHAFANPPFHEAGRVREPVSASKASAHVAPAGALDMWVARLADLVAGGGTVTVIHRAEALRPLLAAFEARLGGVAVLPLAPGERAPATRIVVQGRKGSRSALRLLPPLVLHGPGGRYTSSAEAVLSDGAALDLAR